MAKAKKSTPQQRALILWALLARENAAAFQNELKPEPDKADRDVLKEDGLITWQKHGQRIWIEVTDKGWDWAADHLDAALPAKSNAGSDVLRAWLIRLKQFMEARSLALADILGPQNAPEPMDGPPAKPVTLDYAAVRKRVRDAYLEISGGRLNTRVLLRDLRGKLQDIERGKLDGALDEMQRDQEASLYQLDNRAEITDSDRAAAIYFGNEPRHILWIER